jgi:exodeoxyribonuclease V gamma subunit
VRRRKGRDDPPDYSHRTENLFEQFASDLAAYRAGRSLFETTRLIVPNRNVETWLKRALAARDGIAANFEVLLLRRFVSGLLSGGDRRPPAAGPPGRRCAWWTPSSSRTSSSRCCSTTRGWAHPELAPVRAYLKGGGLADAVDQRRVQLSAQLRPPLRGVRLLPAGHARGLAAAAHAPEGRWTTTELWQRRLWLEAFGPDALLDRRAAATGTRFRTLSQVLAELPDGAFAGERPVFLFGVSYVAAAFQQVLARIARVGELFVYTLNPCMEFWEDLQTGKEIARRDRLPHRGNKLDPSRSRARTRSA